MSTKRIYTAVLKEYLEVIGKKSFTEETTKKNYVQKYFEYLNEETENLPTTKRHKLTILGSLFEKLLSEQPNYFKHVKKLVPPGKVTRPTKSIPHEEVSRLIASAPDEQHKLILALLFHTGLRRHELIALNIDSVRATHLVLPKTKSGEEQLQPVPAHIMPMLLAQVAVRQTHNFSSHPRSDKEALFVVRHSANLYKRMHVETLYKWFKKHCGVSPHAARATAATLLKMKGAEDRDVAKYLRQSSVQMVQIYDKRANVSQKMASLMDYSQLEEPPLIKPLR